MDILKTVREIGFFETSCNLAEVLESSDIWAKAGSMMPLPEHDICRSVNDISESLAAFGKEKYMFLSPEIAVIDKLAEKEPGKANIPKSMNVYLLEEPYFADEFYPRNGIIVICGYLAGGRMMVLPETYRMIEHYNSGFWGKKVFVPYVELPDAVRYDEWLEICNEKISILRRGM